MIVPYEALSWGSNLKYMKILCIFLSYMLENTLLLSKYSYKYVVIKIY